MIGEKAREKGGWLDRDRRSWCAFAMNKERMQKKICLWVFERKNFYVCVCGETHSFCKKAKSMTKKLMEKAAAAVDGGLFLNGLMKIYLFHSHRDSASSREENE